MESDAARAGDGPRVVFGLGNPGDRYEGTRHNLGFEVVDELQRRLDPERTRAECNALVARAGSVVLVRPQTYMNRSGHAARCLVERHGFDPGSMLVVYDEVQLPLGTLRLRRRGSPGGHRGMESMIQSLRTPEIARLRMGVAPEGGAPAGEDLIEFVLEPFRAEERATAREMVRRAADAVELWLQEGIVAAMNRFNG